jgi:hypothetical protein
MMKIEGSGSESGSISQRHRSADPDLHTNVMDPQHCFTVSQIIKCGYLPRIAMAAAKEMRRALMKRVLNKLVQRPAILPLS